MQRIPVAGPWITQREIDYVTDAVTHAWYGNHNVWHERFERAFAAHARRRHAIALPSCTSAIHLSLLALGVGPGDEVIVPDATWIATAAPISYVGATPVFADVDPGTWCVTAETVAACVTPRTKGLLVVDLYGGMPDLDPILALAAERRFAVVEDAAEAAGATYRGRPAGSFGATSVFSFHGSKTLTTGEGGMLLTDDDAIRERVLFLRDHGRRPGDSLFWNTEVAYKYKMTSLQAALGLAQLERLEELIARKRETFGWYREELDGVDGVTLNAEPEETRNAYWMVTAVWDARFGLDKAEVGKALAARGVDTRPFFHPLSSLPAYAATPGVAQARARNRVAYDLSRRAINLPSALSLTREQVARACAAFRETLSAAGPRSRGSAPRS
ncbi:MAG TPA: DegT/DnrJ/EryC1/StrS family aminotransferase [Gemmatimonadaceae bacterium]|nr:DegT/DnrJ/EryC1/StrS family aminotransferase [Gemmatimonadaceae bacterium]